MIDLTPQRLRCLYGASCPSVHRLEDGRLLIIGKIASHFATAATYTGDESDRLAGDAWRKIAHKIGVGEEAIVISPDYFENVFKCQADVAETGEESSLRSSDERSAVHWSDCAIHNGPALPVGECDCGAQPLAREIERLRQENRELRDDLRKALHGDSCLCPDCFKPDAIEEPKQTQRQIEEAGLPADERTAEHQSASLTPNTPQEADHG